MTEHEASRTLVKSTPELWAECSDASSLGRHLDSFGEIRITRLEPETAVAWEGERASGTVRLEPSGWGTRVTITARSAGAVAQPGSEPDRSPPVDPEAAGPAVVDPAAPDPAAPNSEAASLLTSYAEVADTTAVDPPSAPEARAADPPRSADPVAASLPVSDARVADQRVADPGPADPLPLPVPRAGNPLSPGPEAGDASPAIDPPAAGPEAGGSSPALDPTAVVPPAPDLRPTPRTVVYPRPNAAESARPAVRRHGFFARLFARMNTHTVIAAPAPASEARDHQSASILASKSPAATDPAPESPVATDPVPESPVATDPAPESPVATDPAPERPVVTGPASEPAAATAPDPGIVLSAALDSLGQAHHRPYSRA